MIFMWRFCEGNIEDRIFNEIEKCAIIQENVGLQHKLATVKI